MPTGTKPATVVVAGVDDRHVVGNKPRQGASRSSTAITGVSDETVAFAIVILIGGFTISNQAHAVVCANGCTEPDALDPMAR